MDFCAKFTTLVSRNNTRLRISSIIHHKMHKQCYKDQEKCAICPHHLDLISTYPSKLHAGYAKSTLRKAETRGQKYMFETMDGQMGQEL